MLGDVEAEELLFGLLEVAARLEIQPISAREHSSGLSGGTYLLL